MYIISPEVLRGLKRKEKFVIIKHGMFESYLFACLNPLDERIVMAVFHSNHKKVVQFEEADFKDCVIFAGQFEGLKVSEVMLDQLTEEVEKTKKLLVSCYG